MVYNIIHIRRIHSVMYILFLLRMFKKATFIHSFISIFFFFEYLLNIRKGLFLQKKGLGHWIPRLLTMCFKTQSTGRH